ncbi:uncharacterized protein LOC108211895 [Daucus carota subsp. sativus]|uniref:uncharacterized protein LOC108211895 n=1 Tax=Daucus carota subsp. sativus TaxID=79200 RepID=UPI0007F01C1A|nr:PREDICTED: uncharacterized protein LOC108211895 [Daucus carota subsp. sativus]
MKTLRRLTKSKPPVKNDQGGRHVHQAKIKSKLPLSSLIARLMRFDGLRLQRPIHSQCNSFMDQNIPRFSPVALQVDNHLLDSGSHKKRFSDHPECKDMYEDKAGKSGNENGILSRCSTFASTQNYPKQSKIGGEEQKGTDKGTLRIVLLQPNYAMEGDVRSSLSLHDPSRANIFGSRESQSKEAAKRFNGELQEVFSRMRTDFPSYVKEIPGTGGLHDFSGIESASDSEVIKITSSTQQNRLLAGRQRRYC